MDELVRAENLGLKTPGRWIFRGVSFSLAEGQLAWISGPSGGGKTTLLRSLVRLVEPTEGNVALMGRPAPHWPPPQLRRTMVLVPQQPVMAEASVEENLLLPFSFKACRALARPTAQQMLGLLARVGLHELELGAAARKLSVGQAQRLALVRAMLLGPRVLLLDEPLAPLDEEAGEAVMALVAEFVAKGNGAIVVSHQPPPDYSLHLVLKGGEITHREG